MKKLYAFLVMFVIFIVFNDSCYALDRVVLEKNKDEIVTKYLMSRELDTIEGIWSYADGNIGEVAIIKANLATVSGYYDYVAIKLSGNVHGKIGEGKFYLKKTSSDNLFMVLYTFRNYENRQYKETYSFDLLNNDNSLEASNKKETQLKFIRIDDFKRKGSQQVQKVSITKNDVFESLKKLDELRKSGIITEEEFNQQKKKLLDEL